MLFKQFINVSIAFIIKCYPPICICKETLTQDMNAHMHSLLFSQSLSWWLQSVFKKAGCRFFSDNKKNKIYFHDRAFLFQLWRLSHWVKKHFPFPSRSTVFYFSLYCHPQSHWMWQLGGHSYWIIKRSVRHSKYSVNIYFFVPLI